MQTETRRETDPDLLFEKRKQELLSLTRSRLLESLNKPKKRLTPELISLSGWQACEMNLDAPFTLSSFEALFSSAKTDLQKGGFFISTQAGGILLNPSLGSLEQLFQHGLTLHDIDFVILSDYAGEEEREVLKLYELNRLFNQTLTRYEEPPHVIRYLLHPEAYARLVGELRPEYREERQSVRALEPFFGPENEEVIALDETSQLIYTKPQNGKALALRLELQQPKLSFGLLWGNGWDESLAPFFSECEIILAGVGRVSPADLEKLSLQQESLGYFGLSELAKRTEALKLLLVSGFSKSEGDIRLELIKKLKAELALESNSCFIIDHGFSLQLDPLSIKTRSGKFEPYDEVSQVRLDGTFGKMAYVSREHLLA